MIARSPVAPARIAASVPCPPSSSEGTSTTMSSPVEPVQVARRAERPDGGEDRRRRRPSCRTRRGRTAAPSRISPPHGSAVHVAGSPGGTTSRWPDRIRRSPPPARPTRPMTTGSEVRGISSPGQSGSARIAAGSGRTTSTVSPSSRRASAAHVGDGLLGAGDARDADERSRSVDQPGAIDRRARTSATPPQPRRIGRVMQVGPPEPLTPICVAG